ncbi:MAG: phosphatase PAP2 family protein [Nitrospirota bacterium]|nr:phosphatase PAP2 family protein [Nitrospirota bacterium]
MSIITVIFHRRIDSVSYLLSLYSALILIQAVLIMLKDKGGAYRLAHDLIFPLISIAAVFDSLGYIVHYINPIDIDPLLIRLDYRLFNGYPTVMLERFISPLLTDVMQAAYSGYYFLPFALGIALKIRKDDSAAFDYSLFLIMFCFYLSYTGYMLMPALGPRYTMNHLQSMELDGLFITQPVQWLLNRLEGIKRDAFPSGHTGIALTVLYLSFRFEKRLFLIFLPVVTALIFSTVYCRYHYVVDIIGGIFLSVITILMGNMYYGYWTKKNNINN